MTIDQAMELLELEPPANQRQIQLARRKLAKRWHPDRAAPDQRVVDERPMKRGNKAAPPPRLGRGVGAAGPTRGRAVRGAPDAARRARAEAGRRAYEAAQAQGTGEA